MKITTSKKGRPIFVARYVTPEDVPLLEKAGFWRHSMETCPWKNDHCMACEAEADGYYTPFIAAVERLLPYADEETKALVRTGRIPPRMEKEKPAARWFLG
jgi:hypothetical protein